MIKTRACELCCANASLFCPSDNAFLCHKCDSKVHDANFLVARHIRQPLRASENEISDDESSSACISSTTKENKNRRSKRFESPTTSSANEATSERKVLDDIFVSWCRKLGVDDDVVVRTACGALRVCLEKWKYLPFRVSLAASMWVGLRVRVGLGVGEMMMDNKLSVLKKLEKVSGVPSKLILASESKVARAITSTTRVERRKRPVEMEEEEEGWAEC